jgi:hypothetical protein
MKKLVISLVCAALAIAADTTGTWTGKVDVGNPGDDPTIPMALILQQKGSELTGTAGGDVSHQYPIEKAEVNGDSIRFQVTTGPTVLIFDLRQDKDVMAGTAKLQRGGTTVHEGSASLRRK